MDRTSKSRIKGMLRQIFLKSRERSNALKRTGYRCSKCGIKASQAKGREVKIQVHHKKGIDIWDELIAMIEDKLLCIGKEENLEPLCKKCHNEQHY